VASPSPRPYHHSSMTPAFTLLEVGLGGMRAVEVTSPARPHSEDLALGDTLTSVQVRRNGAALGPLRAWSSAQSWPQPEHGALRRRALTYGGVEPLRLAARAYHPRLAGDARVRWAPTLDRLGFCNPRHGPLLQAAYGRPASRPAVTSGAGRQPRREHATPRHKRFPSS